MANIAIIYCSMKGNTHALAEAVAEAIDADGGKCALYRLQFHDNGGLGGGAPEVESLPDYDGLILGSPTRFGNMAGPLRVFLDSTGPLWAKKLLLGRAAGFLTGAGTIHGGHESTVLTMSTYAYHHGMVIVPSGYESPEAHGTRTGGGPYAPTHWSPSNGDKDGLSDDERAVAETYGRRFHRVASALATARSSSDF